MSDALRTGDFSGPFGGSVNYEISHAGLLKLIKGRDIFDLNILLTNDNSDTLRVRGKVWCNQNNEIVNYELELNNDNSPYDGWYFDKYFIESTTSNGTNGDDDDEEWIDGIPNWVVIVGGIFIVMMMFMMVGRK